MFSFAPVIYFYRAMCMISTRSRLRMLSINVTHKVLNTAVSAKNAKGSVVRNEVSIFFHRVVSS